nr:cytochrome b6/f subunit L [Botrychium ternatum]UHY94435.1 cytochrome b6/f subunit L [Botrychium ternatum]
MLTLFSHSGFLLAASTLTLVLFIGLNKIQLIRYKNGGELTGSADSTASPNVS